MSLIRKFVVCGFLTVLATGCAVKKMPEFELKKGSKVGIYVSIPGEIVHLHSRSIFSRKLGSSLDSGPKEVLVGFSLKQRETNGKRFNFYDYAVLTAQALLKEHDFEGIELHSIGLNEAGFTIADFYADGEAQRTLAKKLGISAIISIEATKKEFSAPCIRGRSCDSMFSRHPVLQTLKDGRIRSSYRAVLPVSNSIFVFTIADPIYLERAVNVEELQKYQTMRFQSHNLKHISDQEWATISTQFERLIKANLKNSVGALLPKSTAQIAR